MGNEKLYTEEEVQELRNQYYDEGYENGRRDGYEEGYFEAECEFQEFQNQTNE